MAGSSSDGRALEAAIMGGVMLMTLWGAVIVVADLVFGADVVPHSQAANVVILVALTVVGAVLGGGMAKARR